MISSRYYTSRPHASVDPRPTLSAHERYRVYGPILPLEKPSLLQRIFGKR